MSARAMLRGFGPRRLREPSEEDHAFLAARVRAAYEVQREREAWTPERLAAALAARAQRWAAIEGPDGWTLPSGVVLTRRPAP
jgi:hypothetical protein